MEKQKYDIIRKSLIHLKITFRVSKMPNAGQFSGGYFNFARNNVCFILELFWN